jgi:hypothetical protein
MGTVYEARQISLDRHIALKIVPSEASADPERLRRFDRAGLHSLPSTMRTAVLRPEVSR